jgi:hypothetical protein
VHANDDSFRCANSCDGAGEMLPDDQILARFAFNPYDTQQARFRNVGITDGDIGAVATGRSIQNFDPSHAAQPAGDRLTFAFKTAITVASILRRASPVAAKDTWTRRS